MNQSGLNKSRRKWVAIIGIGPLVATVASLLHVSVAHAATDWHALQGKSSVPPGEDVAATLARLYGGRTIEYSEEKLKFTVPNVAENGAVVPSEIELTAPLSKDVYVKQIIWIIDKNKRPQTIVFDFTPDTGAGYAAAYLRMGQTSWVRAILELSDGKLLGAQKEVKVVSGGCGG